MKQKERGLLEEERRLILFGGKGGAGKTTCASAAALHLSWRDPGRRILIVSTDPASSISDSLDMPIGSEVTSITDNLSGMEIDTKTLQEEFRLRHQVDIFDLATRAMYVDDELLTDLFSFSLPGMDELMTIMRIVNLLDSREHDTVILDTAPTGHTIRLLGYVDHMLERIGIMEQSQEKYRSMKTRMRKGRKGGYRKDEADRFLDRLRGDIKGIKAILSDGSSTEFITVASPEAMGNHESEMLLASLAAYNIPAHYLIINGLFPPEGCGFCSSRRYAQDAYVKAMEQKHTCNGIIRIPLFPHEVRGVDELRKFARVMFGGDFPYTPRRTAGRGPWRSDGRRLAAMLEKNARFLFFVGKGGVGKTICAAATALHLARTRPEKRVLLFSTSALHGLSDCLDREIVSTPTAILPNLFVLESDAKGMFDSFKQRYLDEVNSLFDALEKGGGTVDLSFERRTTLDLLSLTPPGLDEIMALAKLMEFVESREYDTFVIDTAPTGHLVRLLELPDAIIAWFDGLIKTLRKHSGRAPISDTLRFLLETKRKVKETQGVLTDPDNTEFVPVTIPEAMGVFETKRLVGRLHKLGIPSENLIVNKIIPAATCSFCASKREEQDRYIREIIAAFPENRITLMPLLAGDVRGPDALERFAAIMYGGEGPGSPLARLAGVGDIWERVRTMVGR